MRAVWTIILGMCITSSAHAASIDCNKAVTPTEKAICADVGLSSLDSSMADAYTKALATHVAYASDLRNNQRQWIISMQRECNSEVWCIKQSEETRRDFLLALNEPDNEGSDFALNDISEQYAFALHFYRRCVPGPQVYPNGCNGPARLTIQAKDNSRPAQTILLENISIPLEAGEPSTDNAGSTPSKIVGEAIGVGDFNFDGREDFALLVRPGIYGAVHAYDVYLDNGKYFALSQELSDITGPDSFTVDSKTHLLSASYNDGCCRGETDSFKIIDNKPAKYERTFHYYDDSDYIRTERFINGKWKLASEQGKRADDFCEDTLIAVMNPDLRAPIAASTCKPLPDSPQMAVAADLRISGDNTAAIDIYFASIDNGHVFGKTQIKDVPLGHNGEACRNRDTDMAVDTAHYQLTPKLRGTGLRVERYNCVTLNNFTLLFLVYKKDDEVVPILSSLVVASESRNSTINRVLEMSKSANGKFEDIIVHETKTEKSDSDNVVAPREKTYILHYDGKRYIVPDNLKQIPH